MIVELLTKGGSKDLLAPYFTFRHLHSDQQKHQLFLEIAKLRYDVYCTECKYLDETAYEQQLETDHFEDRSIHVAAQNAEGLVVGTVRLVLAASTEEFPFEEHCTVFPDFKFPPRELSGEVSRLIVRKSLRRRSGDSMEGVSKEFQKEGRVRDITPQTKSLFRKNRRSSSPQIMLGMYREMYRYSRENGIRYWYAAMEKGLAGLLRRMGFNFVPVGPETDYYGPVATYVADLRELEITLSQSNQFMLAWFQDEPISDWLLVKTLVKYKLGKGRDGRFA